MPYLTVDERKVFYTSQRGSFAESLLLLHGAGGTHLDWPAELRRLPQTAVYTLDLPGHGRSALPGCDTVANYANVVVDCIHQLGLKAVTIAGHSMGGAIAQEIGLRHLPQVTGLVLIGTGARLPVSNAILDQARSDFDAATAFVTHYSWSPHMPDAVKQAGLTRLRQTNPDTLYTDFVACNNFDKRDEVMQIQCPTLVIAAENDKMAPPKFSQFLAEHILNAQLVTLANTGHMMTLEQPTAVATAIQSFLQTYVEQSPKNTN